MKYAGKRKVSQGHFTRKAGKSKVAKIKRVEIKNFIGLSEYKLEPGKINRFTGHKGSGKSSFIDALEAGFTNKRRRTEIIRHGEDEATIFIQLDNGLEIDRRIRFGKSDYLKNRKSGEPVPQTEDFLRKLIRGEVFRPLEFLKKKPEEQAQIILNLLPIEWTKDNIAEWFGEIPKDVNYEAHILQILKQIEKQYYDERETVNREIKVLEAQVQGIRDELPPNYDGEFWRLQKVQDYYNKVAQAEETNKKIVAARNIINGLEDRIAKIKADAELDKQSKKNYYDRQRNDIREFKQFLNQKIEKAQEKIDQADQRIKEAEKSCDLELEMEIEKLKTKYVQKKADVRKAVETDAQEQKKVVAECQQSVAAKEQELAGIDQLEIQAIERIDESVKQQAEIENAKVGNAKTVLETIEEIPVEPLRVEAEKVANMQSYLREWDRMQLIIRDKLDVRRANSAGLTAKIEKARALPTELLKTVALPIPGMNVDENGLIRVGQTLISDLSEGEQFEFVWKVAKAEAGELKVICLDGVNKVNPAERTWMENEMETDEYQYFTTETTDGDLAVEIQGGQQ